MKLARSAARIVATRGKNVRLFDLERDAPDDESLAKALLGPTGNLRAPALRCGGTLFVGFDERSMRTHLG